MIDKTVMSLGATVGVNEPRDTIVGITTEVDGEMAVSENGPLDASVGIGLETSKETTDLPLGITGANDSARCARVLCFVVGSTIIFTTETTAAAIDAARLVNAASGVQIA